MSITQSQPLDAKSAYRLRQRQFTELQEIWEGTTRHASPRDFIFHQALALNDFTEVRYAVLMTMKKYCQLNGYLNTSQLVGYFRGIIRRQSERRAEREKARNGSRTSRTV
jgi:hypothetical protein